MICHEKKLFIFLKSVICCFQSATNIFLESMQVLEHCQRIDGVLGGTVLYNNK